ncbi:MAG: hypothetical protein PHR25_03750 [Clostridia bacterium]|nr:hypothetical protein [Clostridia bacterium]MDD4375876.1 hypothetical protein [Clostridia bacterium]
MERCLGIYVGDKVVKYIKLHIDKNKNIDIEAVGSKYILGGAKEVIDEIVLETNSQNVPIAINVTKENHKSIPVIKTLSKSNKASMIDIEIEDIANKQGLNKNMLMYTFDILDSLKNSENEQVNILYVNKSDVEQYSKIESLKIQGVYPLSSVVSGLVPKEEKNYAVINIEEETTLNIVLEGKQVATIPIEEGMKRIVEDIADYVGSYAKAYETCKTINVYTQETNLNNPEIEKLIEPVLQKILHHIETALRPYRGKFQKMFISGMAVLFTNIDILFEQYFGMTAQILKPYFTKGGVGIRNVAEVIESNSAAALANAMLLQEYEKYNFSNQLEKKAGKKGFNKKALKKIGVQMPTFSYENLNSLTEKVVLANLIGGTLIVGYLIFGITYTKQIKKIEKDIDNSISQINEQSALIKKDTEFITRNKEKYKEVNDMVVNIVDKIQANDIGNYRTYNVANFMQQIMKFIPKDVQLISISSNDNKHLEIVAKSNSYAALGYFVSQLKLEGIINGVKIEKVTHGEEIEVSIGGDLP